MSGTPTLPGPTDFIRRTNADYAAWCATYYAPDALDDRGMVSLHGLWAWQEQQRRIDASTPAPSTAQGLSKQQLDDVFNTLIDQGRFAAHSLYQRILAAKETK